MPKSNSMATVTAAVKRVADADRVATIEDICEVSGLDISRVNGCISYYVRAGLAEHSSGNSIRVLDSFLTWMPGSPTPVDTAKLPHTGKARKNKIDRDFLVGFGYD